MIMASDSRTPPEGNIHRSGVFLMFIGIVCLGMPNAASAEPQFQYSCLFEETLAELYKKAIFDANATVNWRAHEQNGLSKDSFTTEDGGMIHGLVWRAPNPQGYVIVVQGTSMLAAELYNDLPDFRSIGLDVYLYDYRGYGASNKLTTTLEGMISDYRKRISELNELPGYSFHFGYGISMGGIVILNAVLDLAEPLHGLVFDSVPHAIPWYAFCPNRLNPVRILPEKCTIWLIIAAERDRVIGRRAAKFAKRATASCGAEQQIKRKYGHVYMDRNFDERANAAVQHFASLMAQATIED